MHNMARRYSIDIDRAWSAQAILYIEIWCRRVMKELFQL
jgi:hypothetical protein